MSGGAAPIAPDRPPGGEPYSYRRDPLVPAFPDDRPILIFDGHCALCSGSAQFVLRHDRAAAFRLLPAQTALGAALYAHYGRKPGDYETIILIEAGRAYFKSEGAIRVLERLGAPWSLAGALRLAPAFLRDRLYDFVARNRLRWFGRREQCFAPAPGWADRFLS